MVKLKKLKKAFTVVEILLTLTILGFVLLMTISNATKQLPDTKKAKYKKAYSTVEKTVAALINDEDLYPSLFLGFKYTRPAITEFGDPIGSSDTLNAPDKFRDAFKFVVNPIKDGISCGCLGDCNNDCFMTDEGVVYGVPNTNFVNNLQTNKYKTETGDGNVDNYLPIAIYTDWERVEKDQDAQEKSVMYIGVQYDGNVRIFYPSSCGTSNKHQYCKAEEYLMSDTIKRSGK